MLLLVVGSEAQPAELVKMFQSETGSNSELGEEAAVADEGTDSLLQQVSVAV